MEKRKKRDKACLSNADSEGGGSDNQLCKEGDVQNVVVLQRSFHKMGSPAQENAAMAPQQQQQQNPPILQWPYTSQQLQETQSVQFSCQPATAHGQQQTFVSLGRQQSQVQPPQQMPFWAHPEMPVPTSAPIYPSFGLQQGSTDATMLGVHSATDHALPPYGYHPSYPYPVGYPGPWDPTWWAHAQHQPQYPYPYPPLPPSYGSAYGYITSPAVPPIAAGVLPSVPLQRGIIRPPVGLSQKHQRLWESQSAENVQLWAALARFESELNANRGRLMKVESELYSLKTHYEATADASTAAAANTTQVGRKARNKRSLAATTLNLSSPDTCQPRKTRGRRITMSRRMAADEKEKTTDADKDKESRAAPEKEKATNPTAMLPTSSSHSFPQEKPPEKLQPMFTNHGSDSEHNKIKTTSSTDFQASIMCQNHVFTNDAHNLQFNTTINQLTNFATMHGTERKCNDSEQNADKKSIVTGPLQTSSNFIDHNKTSETAEEEGSASYRAVSNRGNGWPSDNSRSDGVRNLMVEGRTLHPFYDHNGHILRSDIMRGGKIMSAWGYVCNNPPSQEQQDEVVPSAKEEDEEEMDEDADSALQANRSKGEAILRLDSVQGIPKGSTHMNRW